MDPETLTLTAGTSRLVLDRAGRLVTLDTAGRPWLSQPAHCFELTLQQPSTPSVLGVHRRVTPRDIRPRIECQHNLLRLHYDHLTLDDTSLDVQIVVEIAAEDGEFTFRFSLANGAPDWTVREIRGPFVTAPMDEEEHPALIWPLGAGERIVDPRRAGALRQPYPTRLFMPWMALDAGDAGLYLAYHDASLQTITLNADASVVPGAIELSFGLLPFCKHGETWQSAPVVIRPYSGPWHEAAARYRRWADTWYRPIRSPEWLRTATGWQLVILKQQNGEIHWPYADIDRLIELGKENGLNMLGLFGWTDGGHDRRYPIYEPDQAMGGEHALRRAIRRAHDAGQRVILYTNGQLLDMQTEWYAEFGPQTAAVSERGEPFGETWAKYKDGAPRPMAYACQSCGTWSDKLLDLAKRVQSLGADGIIFDQLGSCHPMLCFSERHGHAKPTQAIGPGVAATLARVQRELHAIAPDFIVMVEHVTDGINQIVDLTHGCGVGFCPSPSGFPELLRFTFPEILATQRHPTPAMDRNTANWACLYGFAHEVEYRYWPDRLYIEHGAVPAAGDYERVGSPPDVATMRRLAPRESAAYLRAVAEFEQRHADLLRDGRFRDVLGFAIDNPAVQAKAYAATTDLGVLVWNPTATPQPVRVTVENAQFAAADAPGEEQVDPSTPLPPESMRLLRYRLTTRHDTHAQQ